MAFAYQTGGHAEAFEVGNEMYKRLSVKAGPYPCRTPLKPYESGYALSFRLIIRKKFNEDDLFNSGHKISCGQRVDDDRVNIARTGALPLMSTAGRVAKAA